MSRSAEVEQRALALVERLLDEPLDDMREAALLSREPEAVRVRVAALKAAMADSAALLPTEFAGLTGQREAIAPPDHVGAFRLVRRIGAGGMGGVWLAERDDGLYEQQVAVKFIRPGLVNLAGGAFRTERRILARLEHPGIARLIDGGVTAEGTPYLVMEYVDGSPIDIALEALDLPARVRIFAMAADAVQFAHSRLVVHADLKPSNILVDRQGRVRLLDFGIARLIGGEGEASGAPQPMTAAYASPQRHAGAAPTTADDVYALGCILAELVEAGDPDLAAIAAKARAADEGDRYGSAAALIADLDRWRDRLPVAARPATPGYRIRKFTSRHRAGVLATCAALAALGALAGIATHNARQATQAGREARDRFEDARGAARLVSDELLTQLASRPGTFALRSSTVQAAQFYLDRLAASRTAPADIRLEAAEGLQRVAEAQAKPGRPNLGLTDQAHANLGKALGLVEGIEGEAARLLAMRILLDRARLSCYARNDIPGALADLKQAERLLAASPRAPLDLRAQYLIELASVQQWNSEYATSIATARAALRLLRTPRGTEQVVQRAMALDLLAEGTYYLDRAPEAIPPYREALALLLAEEQARPGDQMINRRIARAQWALGSTLVGHGDSAEAVALLADSTRRAGAIVAADPDDQDARRMLRIAENARGQAVAAAGRVDEGVAIIRGNIAERKAWLDRRPRDPMRLRDYMVAIKGLGDLQLEHGRTADACRSFAQAQELVGAIEARGQLTALDLMSVARSLAELRRRHCAATDAST